LTIAANVYGDGRKFRIVRVLIPDSLQNDSYCAASTRLSAGTFGGSAAMT
jgi:hypothetical protein